MKRILSVLLAGMMIASMTVVSVNAFVPTREVTYTASDVLIEQKYDGQSSDFTDTDNTDNYFVGPNIKTVSTTVLPAKRLSYTVEFDVYLNQTYDFTGYMYRAIFGAKGRNDNGLYALALPLYGMEKDVIRTFKFDINEAGNDTAATFANVMYKDANDSDWTILSERGAYNDASGNEDTTYRGWSAPHAHITSRLDDSKLTLGCTSFYGTGGFEKTICAVFNNVRIKTKGTSTIGAAYTTNGLLNTEDFETAPGFNSNTNVILKAEKEDSGNTYYTLAADAAAISATAASGSAMVYASYGSNVGFVEPNSVVTVDLRCDYEYAPFYIWDTNNGYEFAIGILGKADGNWYTYKIEIGDCTGKSIYANFAELVKIYRKPRGAADSAYVQLINGADTDSTQYDSSVFPDAEFIYQSGYGSGIKRFGMGFLGHKTSNTEKELKMKYSVDNLQIRKNAAYSGVYTKEGANLFVDTNEDAETVFMASYDGGRMVDVDFKALDGADNNAQLAVTEGSSASKIFIWNLEEDGAPVILAAPIEIQ